MIVLDACSVILLAKSTILEDFTKWKKTMIPQTVYKEVLESKDKKLLDALLTEKLVEEKKIIIKNCTNQDILKKLKSDFGLGDGEAEAIALALETGDKIITDNKQGRKAAKIYRLELVGSIEVIVSLFKEKKINREKTLSALTSLKNIGWFQDYLIEKALEEVQNE